MKTIYKCDICGKTSENISVIEECEKEGIPNLDEVLSLNVIYQGKTYENITFLTKKAELFDGNNHLYNVSGYATRDNGHGDSLGDEMFSEPHLYRDFFFKKHHEVYDFKSDHFKRMVKWLIDNNLPVKYWNGEKVCEFSVPDDFFKEESKEESKEEPKEKHFRCRYGMYLHNKGIESSISGFDIVDAIKKRNQNAILISITDENGINYICKEHYEADSNGYYNYYWINEKTGEIVYDENKGEPDKAVDKNIIPISDEDFFDCNRPLEDGEERYEDELLFEEFEELPDVISVDYGVGLKFKDDKGKEYITIKDEKREVIFRISTYRGISVGAIHYYGRLVVYDLSLKHENGISNIGGSFDKFKPKEAKGFDIEIQRKITEKELKDYPDRFKGYRVGSSTSCFYTKKSLIEAGKKVFKRKFEEGWELCIDD